MSATLTDMRLIEAAEPEAARAPNVDAPARTGEIAQATTPPPQTAASPTVSVSAYKHTDRAVVTLTWPEPPMVEHSMDGRDIVLRFDRELQAPGLLSLVEATGEWLDSATQGYDSLLLRAALDVNYAIEVVGSSVHVTLTRVTAPSDLRGDAQRLAADHRLRLLEIELKARTDGALAARSDAEQMLAANPDSADAMLMLAEVETRLGNWQSTLDLYRRFLDSTPDSLDVLKAQRDLRREHGPHYRFDTVRQVIDGADTQGIYRQRGSVNPWARGEIGADWEIRQVDTPSATRLNGDVAPFQGVRQRAEIYGQHNFDAEAVTVRGALLAGAGTAGLAARGELRRDQSRSSLAIDFRRAYWDYVEGFTNEGRRDRIALDHARALGEDERILGDIVFAMNRYGVRGDSDVATSFQPSADLAYVLFKGFPTVTLNYNVDAEYRFGRETRIGPGGLPFAPLSIVSREVHTALVGVSGQTWEYLRFSTFAGYGWDRINTESKGPRYGAELVVSPHDQFELGLNFLYAQASSRGSGSVLSRYGAHLLVRF